MARPPSRVLEDSHPELADALVDQSLRRIATSSSRRVIWRCSTHSDHVWEAQVFNRTQAQKPTGCPFCSGKKVLKGFNDCATVHPERAKLFLNPDDAFTHTPKSNKKVMFHCSDPAHDPWEAPVARVMAGSGCPQCAGRIPVVGVNDLATTHPELAAELADPSDATRLQAGSGKATWLCPTHGTWEAAVSSRTLKKTGCPVCSRKRKNVIFSYTPLNEPLKHIQYIDEIVGIIQKLCPKATIRKSVTDLLPDGRELDIVIDEHRLAIEFNGLYWHCETVTPDPNYHAQKIRNAATQGYMLMHIWEDDWHNRKNIVIRALAHRLHATSKLSAVCDDPTVAETHYARTLTAQIITDASVAKEFWNTHHLQGAVGCDVNIALVNPAGDIKALLGIGKKNHGSTTMLPEGTWDIQRYATACSVPGGFSKLLAYAQKQYDVKIWVSFSHNDISAGQMYVKTGFTAVKSYPPSYSYVGTPTKWVRKHRLNYTLQRFKNDPTLLYEDGWSEHQTALANGLYRIYNAGVTKWVKNL